MKEDSSEIIINIEYRMYLYKNKIRMLNKRIYKLFSGILGRNTSGVSEKYVKTDVLNLEDAYSYIELLINGDTPFLIGRYGGSELKMIRGYLEKKYMGDSKDYVNAQMQLCELSGFFPKDTVSTDKFVELMLELSKDIDLLGIWYNDMEDYVCKKYAINACFTELRNLEPYYGIDRIKPWTRALQGKTVLVIHPFADSIRYQYERKELIWGDRELLPEFELKTIKAVQTLASQSDARFSTWFDALDYMVEECRKIEFDVALVGCGAYGLPLGEEIKKMGKGAIHLGGALQVLFGIKGKRWDKHPYISTLYNEYWIRPMENEKPQGYERVEEGCYW